MQVSVHMSFFSWAAMQVSVCTPFCSRAAGHAAVLLTILTLAALQFELRHAM